MSSFPPESQFYGVQPSVPTPPPRSKTPLILGVVGGIVAVGALFCCGGGAMLVKFGLDVMGVEIQDDLATRPEIQENIGAIESFKVNLVRSGAHSDNEVFIYDIEGTKGKGYVTVEQITRPDGTEGIVSAELTMSDGRKIPIDVSQ